MKIIDLTVSTKHQTSLHIHQYCGGITPQSRWLTGFHKGLGGLAYLDPVAGQEDEKYQVILAFYARGLGMYFRNIYANKLILLQESEIKSIKISCIPLEIKPLTFSVYTILSRLGIPDHISRKFLMPVEIVTEYPDVCTILTEEHFFDLHLEKISFSKLVNTLKKTTFADKLNVTI